MNRHIGVALITMMLGFTGIANAGDVAIAHAGLASDGSAASAWVVIEDKVYFCSIGAIGEEGSHERKCFLMEMPD